MIETGLVDTLDPGTIPSSVVAFRFRRAGNERDPVLLARAVARKLSDELIDGPAVVDIAKLVHAGQRCREALAAVDGGAVELALVARRLACVRCVGPLLGLIAERHDDAGLSATVRLLSQRAHLIAMP